MAPSIFESFDLKSVQGLTIGSFLIGIIGSYFTYKNTKLIKTLEKIQGNSFTLKEITSQVKQLKKGEKLECFVQGSVSNFVPASRSPFNLSESEEEMYYFWIRDGTGEAQVQSKGATFSINSHNQQNQGLKAKKHLPAVNVHVFVYGNIKLSNDLSHLVITKPTSDIPFIITDSNSPKDIFTKRNYIPAAIAISGFLCCLVFGSSWFLSANYRLFHPLI